MVRTVAAQMAHPCLSGGQANLTVAARIGAGGSLRWFPQPTILAARSNLIVRTDLHLDEHAAALWHEEYILGRTGEEPSSVGLVTRLSADLAGQPLVRDAVDTSREGTFGPAVLGDARYVASIATLGTRSSAAGAHQLAGLGSIHRIVNNDVATGRSLFEEMSQSFCETASG